MTINRSLEELDACLRMYNMPNYNRLQNGATDEMIDDLFNTLKIDDEDLRLLFKWKNGFYLNNDANIRCQIFNFDSLLSLESILEMINARGKDFWGEAFIPLVSDDAGDCILFNNGEGEDHGKLHLYSVSLLFIDEPISYYDSLQTMLETTITAYREGAFRYDAAEDWLNVDTDAFAEIAEKINHRSEYWKLK